MAWDSKRPVPWKRLGRLFGLYAVVMVVLSLWLQRDRPISEVLPAMIVGLVIAFSFMVVMTKFGWTMPALRSREQNMALRQQRMAQRASRKAGSPDGGAPGSATAPLQPRPRAAPTSRTTTGPSQHPRRTAKDRKR
jgi:hypothetical protein